MHISLPVVGVLSSLFIKKDQCLFYLSISAPLKKENEKINKVQCQKILTGAILCINKTKGIIPMSLRVTVSYRDKMVINGKFVLARGGYQV